MINGLETLQLVKLISYFQVRNVDIKDIIQFIVIDPKESGQYMKLMSEIYPLGFDEDIKAYIRYNIEDY